MRLVILSLSLSSLGLMFARDCIVSNKILKDQASISSILSTASYGYNVKLNKTFPISILKKTINVNHGIQELKNYSENIKSFNFNSVKRDTLNSPEIYVLVIGEAARRNNFGIFGYEKNTTPILDTISNLIPFKDVKSSANVTSFSLAHMLTRATPNTDEIKYSEPAILNAFKEAGFKTYWISNQAIGIGGVFGFYTDLAEEYESIAVSLDVSVFDENLIPKFNKILQDKNNPKKFIIIHTIGSHFRYNLRYPSKFDVFQPSLKSGLSLESNSLAIKTEIVNSYDNSILYTDFILGNFIEKLKKQNSISSLFYISDHGENLYDDQREYLLHGFNNPTQYEIEIPLLIWNSKKYKTTFAKKDAVLKSNINARISTTNTFHTLLDIANITYPEEKLDKSFASEKFDSLQKRFLLKTDKSVIQLD